MEERREELRAQLGATAGGGGMLAIFHFIMIVAAFDRFAHSEDNCITVYQVV